MSKHLNYLYGRGHRHLTPVSNALRHIEFVCITFLLLRGRTILFPSLRKWDFYSDQKDMLIKSALDTPCVLGGLSHIYHIYLYVSRINGNDGIANTLIIQEAAHRGEVCKYLEIVIKSSQSLQTGACDEDYSSIASDWRAWLEMDASMRWWIGGGKLQHLSDAEKRLKNKETESILNVWVVKECGLI